MKIPDVSGLSAALLNDQSNGFERLYRSYTENVFGIRWHYIFLFCVFLVLLLYLPAFVRDFAVHNDYMIWSYNNRKCCLVLMVLTSTPSVTIIRILDVTKKDEESFILIVKV